MSRTPRGLRATLAESRALSTNNNSYQQRNREQETKNKLLKLTKLAENDKQTLVILQKSIQRLNQELASRAADVTQLQSNGSKIAQQLASRVTEVTQLRLENQTLHKQLLVTKDTNVVARDAKVTALEQQVASLTRQLQAASATQSQAQQSTERALTLSQKEVVALKASLAQNQQALTVTKQQMKATEAQLELHRKAGVKDRTTAVAESTTLQEKLQAMTEQHQVAQVTIDSLRSEISGLNAAQVASTRASTGSEQQLANVRRQLAQSKAASSKAQTQARTETTLLQGQILSLTASKKQAVEALKKLQAALSVTQQHQSSTHEQVALLQAQLAQAQAQASTTASGAAAIKGVLAQTEAKYKRTASMLNEASTQIDGLKADKRELEATLHSQKLGHTAAESSLAELRAELQATQIELRTSTEGRIAMLRKHKAAEEDLSRDLTNAQRKVSTFERKEIGYEGKLSKMASLTVQLDVAQATTRKLQRQLAVDKVDLDKLRAIEKEVHTAVAKLIRAQDGMDASFTCLSCVDTLNEPTTCVPCGHTFCRSCIQATDSSSCPECKQQVSRLLTNNLLSNLSGKFTFARQTVAWLQQQLDQSKVEPNSVRSAPARRDSLSELLHSLKQESN